MSTINNPLPGLDCGLCGSRTCLDFAAKLAVSPELIQRCIHLSDEAAKTDRPTNPDANATTKESACSPSCAMGPSCQSVPLAVDSFGQTKWQDSLGRDFDFFLEHFPEEPGPREIIIPHNPMITREMDVQKGDVLIGRPLGMSCGCPVTHCGIATEVDHRTGVITWCVTGPLGPRQHGFKDLGYYSAEGYAGIIHETRRELKFGARYFFQPRMCMLQWRHSGLINYLSHNGDYWQVRLEGLWIG